MVHMSQKHGVRHSWPSCDSLIVHHEKFVVLTIQSRRGNRCNQCRADEATRERCFKIGDNQAIRTPPRVGPPPTNLPLAHSQPHKVNRWMTAQSRTAQFETLSSLSVTHRCRPSPSFSNGLGVEYCWKKFPKVWIDPESTRLQPPAEVHTHRHRMDSSRAHAAWGGGRYKEARNAMIEHGRSKTGTASLLHVKLAPMSATDPQVSDTNIWMPSLPSQALDSEDCFSES